MKKLFLALLMIGQFYFCSGAFEVQMINPENTSCANIVSLWPGGLNFATIMKAPGVNFRIAYTNLYGLQELSYQAFNITWNRKNNYGFGCRVNTFGDKLYRESLIATGYTKSIYNRIHVSLGLSYYLIDIQNSYKTWSIVADLGGLFEITPNITASILYKNINNGHLKVSHEPLPKIFASGISWQVNKSIELGAEIYKDILFPFSTKFGAKINIFSHVKINSGVQFDPNRYSLGFSFYWKNFEINTGYRTHLNLPSTLHFGCHISIK